MKVTNNSKALQGVHTETGVIYIKPGDTVDVTLTPEGHKLASRLDVLKVQGDAPKSSKEVEDEEKDQLIAELKTYGIEAGKNSKVETLREKLEKAKADAQQ